MYLWEPPRQLSWARRREEARRMHSAAHPKLHHQFTNNHPRSAPRPPLPVRGRRPPKERTAVRAATSAGSHAEDLPYPQEDHARTLAPGRESFISIFFSPAHVHRGLPKFSLPASPQFCSPMSLSISPWATLCGHRRHWTKISQETLNWNSEYYYGTEPRNSTRTELLEAVHHHRQFATSNKNKNTTTNVAYKDDPIIIALELINKPISAIQIHQAICLWSYSCKLVCPMYLILVNLYVPCRSDIYYGIHFNTYNRSR
jgi:hypothetical protein